MSSTSETISKAIEQLEASGISPETPGIEFLKEIAKYPWIKASKEEYSYGRGIFKNGKWQKPPSKPSDPSQQSLPPGSVRIGIVLSKNLEVSVVQRSRGLKDWRFHRPMAILRPGDFVGAFELADFLSGNPQPEQRYVVYSGIRTFFFSDPRICDAAASNLKKEPKGAILKALSGIEGVKRGSITNWENCLDSDESAKFSVTQAPHKLLGAFLPDDSNWRSEILLVDISSEFRRKEFHSLRETIWNASWVQSAHLREKAIAGYEDDRIIDILFGKTGEKSGGGNVRGSSSIPAIAREFGVIPLLLEGGRPGFRKQACSDARDCGPFPEFAQAVQSLPDFDGHIFLPSYYHDRIDPLIWPIWPNFDPKKARTNTLGNDSQSPGVVRHVKKLRKGILRALLSDKHPYHRIIFRPKSSNRWPNATLLERASVILPVRTRSIPALNAVSPRKGELKSTPCALVAVQHLLEETVAMFDRVIQLKIVAPENITIIGKPYSANPCIANRLRTRGITVKVPTESWPRGSFDEWFDERIVTTLRKVSEKWGNDPNPILLLDDGGSLIRSAGEVSREGGYVGVEQTSRGNQAAFDAKFPVVLVSSSALKVKVEPEFVCRAAVKKLSHYFPETLTQKTIGIVGLGNLGKRFARYLVERKDIHVEKLIAYKCDESIEDEESDELDLSKLDVVDLLAEGNRAEIDCDVIFGCRGKDISDLLPKDLSGKLLVSLSSSDVEFQKLLRWGRGERVTPETMRDTVETGGGRIAFGGFPITFDRGVASGPLIEWQMTRALLLAGIVQVLREDNTAPGAQPLGADAQFQIYTAWLKHLGYPNGSDAETLLPAVSQWRAARDKEVEKTTEFDWLRKDKELKEVRKANESAFSNAKSKAHARSS